MSPAAVAGRADSKGGVMLMMKSIAQEVAPHRIRVNSISTGAIRITGQTIYVDGGMTLYPGFETGG
jgi:enoyl-ACP reductase-like protein